METKYYYFKKEDCYCSLDKFYEQLIKLDRPKYLEGFQDEKEALRNILIDHTKVGISFWALREIFNYYSTELGAMDEETLLIFHQRAPKTEIPEDRFVASVEEDWCYNVNFNKLIKE